MTAILLATVITACGYKGPLYLPKPEPEAQKPAAAAPDEKKNDGATQ